jgi:ABC-type dipeptide/oligopeptide/nickel transport system permease component
MSQAQRHDGSGDLSITDVMDIGRKTADRNAIARTVTLVGGAMVTILLTAVVLNEIFQAVNVGSGPFSSIGTDLETTGVAAVSLLIVGLIVVAANRIMGIFGGGGMG